MEKVVIISRINEYTMRDKNPNVPYSPEEIANQALECWREGASILHYHARDPKTGEPSSKTELYAEVIQRVRAKSDMILFPTLGGPFFSPEDRTAHLIELAKDPSLKPEIAPIDMGSINMDLYDPQAKRFMTEEFTYMNTTKTLKYFANTMRSLKIKPMLVQWSVGHIRATLKFLEMGLFQEPLFIELIIGAESSPYFHPPTVKGIEAYLNFIPKNLKYEWDIVGFGVDLLSLVEPIIERGGHLHLGLGDYGFPELGTPTNAEVTAEAVKKVRKYGRDVATPDEVRTAMGLV
jgi:3-keto-5-aminohexanoate cleavage enzyme